MKKTILISQVKADLICIEYSDKLFISITTTGKPGTSVSLTQIIKFFNIYIIIVSFSYSYEVNN